tara:strand:+ start:387 stop:590 length:204 start_codon:yes stop_codon:yes gene_type:complete
MKTLQGILGMAIWTAVVAAVLYLCKAHDNYGQFGWAILIGFVLLLTHVVNMVIYFKVAGKQPYKWFK